MANMRFSELKDSRIAAAGGMLAMFEPRAHHDASHPHSIPKAALISGPARPIQNSAAGLAACFSILVTPPNANSVMVRTCMP